MGNFDVVFNGLVSLVIVLWLLLNVFVVDLLDWVGLVCFVVWLLYVGIILCFLCGSSLNLLLILGGIGVWLEDLVGVFVVFNCNGIVGWVCYIVDDVVIEWWLMLLGVVWIICEVFEFNLCFGYGIGIFDVIGWLCVVWKIGISYGYCDVWVIGSMWYYMVGVWVGWFDGILLFG